MLTNRLGAEKSPYLLQHRHNPVAWQPWDETAFEAARSLDRPVFLSIGYSTCHWCHVMERESFESAVVAELLNRAFVPIKVDREERPDVDAIYMEATQALTGHGGWPMSVWLTPDRAPFFCGTYFPPERFVLVLTRIAEIWRDQRQDLLTQAETVLEALRRAGERPPRATIDDRPLALLLDHWEQRFDPLHGGFRGAPKFPQAAQLRALLRIARRAGTARPLTLVRTTLDGMCRGGIYDHLGGGFARYSVDEAWSVPHFEKMLYDQAALADAYLESWQVSGLAEDALVVRETLDYLLRELRDPCGAFHTAEDADSEGEEGRYYVWTESELRSLAGERFDLLAAALGVSRHGNFEHGTNILALQPGHDRTTRSADLRGLIEELRQIRDQRVHPHRDDKILTDWNGLAIGALARAARALPDARYLAAAQIAAEFVWQELRTPRGTLCHRWREGEAAIEGFVDDYAFMIEALIELHQADLDPRWLDRAVQLQELQDQLFFDHSRGDYRFATGSDPLVPVVRYESFDGVVPAGRSVSALNLQRLALLTGKQAWAEQADRLFAATPDALAAAPAAFAHLLLALDFRESGGREVSIEGPDRDRSIAPFLAQLRRGFQPALLVRHAPGESAPRARVCEPGACLPWTDDPAEAARQAQRFRPLVIGG